MTEGSPIYSLAYGTLFMALDWDDQPSDLDPTLIFELFLTDGILAFLVLENRLLVEIGRSGVEDEVMTDQWITPELVRKEGSAAVISLQWKDGKLTSFRLNATEVPRSSEVDEFVLGSQEPSIDEPTKLDTTAMMNVNLRRIKGPVSSELSQLIQTATRLETSMMEMHSNTPEKVFDIALYLRTLLCGTTKNGGKLLFRCAEDLGIVPVCYIISGLESNVGVVPFMDDKTIALHSGVAGSPTKKMQFETDLKQWIEQPAIITLNPKLRLKHWELIYQVAGKFGAHADSDHEIFHSFMNPHEAGINLGILVPQFRSYGDMALEVSKQIIFRAQPA